jgi:hypothetical protein
MPLTRLQQVFFYSEATEATAPSMATLFAAGQGSYLAIDPSIEFTPKRTQRNIRSSVLTPRQDLVGQVTGRGRVGLEMTGSALTVATVPQIGLPLQACGMRQENLIKATIGAITGGPFLHGERLNITGGTGSGSNDVGTVILDTYTGTTTLFYARANGLSTHATAPVDTSVLTGATSGASATISGTPLGNAAIGWWPNSFAITKITMDTTGLTAAITANDVIRGVTSRALAQCLESVSTGASAVIRCRRISGHFSTGEVLENITIADADVGSLAAANFETQLVSPTVSFGMAKDGVQEALYGCRGSFSIQGRVGEPVIFNFDLQGVYNSHRDAANVASIAFPQFVPPIFQGIALAVGDKGGSTQFSPCIANFDFNLNNTISQRVCANEAQGVQNFEITARAPSGTIDPELSLEALYPILARFVGNTNIRIGFGVGSADGNAWKIQVPAAAITAMPTGDRDGIATRQVTFAPNTGTSGISAFQENNDIVIVVDCAI